MAVRIRDEEVSATGPFEVEAFGITNFPESRMRLSPPPARGG